MYSPSLNTIFASRNVTFDNTLYPMKDRDQLVYGYWDNEAITQMRADAYCSSDLEPETADIDNCFEPFRDEEVTDKAISTGLLDNAVHPAVAKARHQQQSNPDALLRGGEDATAGNVTQA
eukprot:573337-Rhodomonas_salina.1